MLKQTQSTCNLTDLPEYLRKGKFFSDKTGVFHFTRFGDELSRHVALQPPLGFREKAISGIGNACLFRAVYDDPNAPAHVIRARVANDIRLSLGINVEQAAQPWTNDQHCTAHLLMQDMRDYYLTLSEMNRAYFLAGLNNDSLSGTIRDGGIEALTAQLRQEGTNDWSLAIRNSMLWYLNTALQSDRFEGDSMIEILALLRNYPVHVYTAGGIVRTFGGNLLGTPIYLHHTNYDGIEGGDLNHFNRLVQHEPAVNNQQQLQQQAMEMEDPNQNQQQEPSLKRKASKAHDEENSDERNEIEQGAIIEKKQHSEEPGEQTNLVQHSNQPPHSQGLAPVAQKQSMWQSVLSASTAQHQASICAGILSRLPKFLKNLFGQK